MHHRVTVTYNKANNPMHDLKKVRASQCQDHNGYLLYESSALSRRSDDSKRSIVLAYDDQRPASVGLRSDTKKISTAMRGSRLVPQWVLQMMYSTFLPVNYPRSVEEGYLQYQIWDVVQGLCSYLRGQLAVQQMLEGFGVGNVEATASAGALGWIMRDGASMLGSLVFSSLAATDFGIRMRQWRLFADVVNDVGLTLNMVAPVFGPEMFLPIACAGAVCTTMCGVAAGATKAKISQHFARDNNLADLVAKEGTQETFVNMLGLVGGYLFLRALGSYDNDGGDSSAGSITWMSFVFLTVLHVVANVCAIRCLRLRTVNTVRFHILFKRFCGGQKGSLAGLSASAASHGGMGIEDVANSEPLLPSYSGSRPCLRFLRGGRTARLRIRLGARVSSLQGLSIDDVRARVEAAQTQKYIVFLQGDDSAAVMLRQGACGSTMLQAQYHACVLLHHRSDTEDHSQDAALAQSLEFLRALEEHGWDTSSCELGASEWRYEW